MLRASRKELIACTGIHGISSRRHRGIEGLPGCSTAAGRVGFKSVRKWFLPPDAWPRVRRLLRRTRHSAVARPRGWRMGSGLPFLGSGLSFPAMMGSGLSFPVCATGEPDCHGIPRRTRSPVALRVNNQMRDQRGNRRIWPEIDCTMRLVDSPTSMSLAGNESWTHLGASDLFTCVVDV